jgi:hypothetical protein
MAKVKEPIFVKMTKVVKGDGEMFLKAFPKIGKYYKVRKHPPKASYHHFMSFPKGKCAPLFLNDWEKVKLSVGKGPHTLGAPLGARLEV